MRINDSFILLLRILWNEASCGVVSFGKSYQFKQDTSIWTEMVISIKTRICKGYPKVADQVVYWGVLKCCKPQGLLYAKPFTKPSSLHSMGVYLTICHNIPVVCPFFLALQGFGVLACAWHPHQPWLFTAGSDGRAYLWAWHAHIRKNPMRLLSSQPIATEQMWWRIKTPTGKRRSNSGFYLSSSWRFGNMPSRSKFSKQSPDLPQCVCNLCSAQFSQYTLVASCGKFHPHLVISCRKPTFAWCFGLRCQWSSPSCRVVPRWWIAALRSWIATTYLHTPSTSFTINKHYLRADQVTLSPEGSVFRSMQWKVLSYRRVVQSNSHHKIDS